jgi:hypothetical protein
LEDPPVFLKAQVNASYQFIAIAVALVMVRISAVIITEFLIGSSPELAITAET